MPTTLPPAAPKNIRQRQPKPQSHDRHYRMNENEKEQIAGASQICFSSDITMHSTSGGGVGGTGSSSLSRSSRKSLSSATSDAAPPPSIAHPALHNHSSTCSNHSNNNNCTNSSRSSIHSRTSSLDAEQSSIHSLRKVSKKRQGKIHKLNPVRLLRRIPAVLSSPPSSSPGTTSPSHSAVEPDGEDVVMITETVEVTDRTNSKQIKRRSSRRLAAAKATANMAKSTPSPTADNDRMEVDALQSTPQPHANRNSLSLSSTAPPKPLKTITIHQGDGFLSTSAPGCNATKALLAGSLTSLAGNVNNFIQSTIANNAVSGSDSNADENSVAAATTTTVSFDATHLNRCDVLPMQQCPMKPAADNESSSSPDSNSGTSRLKQTYRRLSLSKKSLPNLLQQSIFHPASQGDSVVNNQSSSQLEPFGAPFSAVSIPSVPMQHAKTIDVPLCYKKEQKRLFSKPSFLKNHPFKSKSAVGSLESIEESSTTANSQSQPPFSGFQNVPLQRFGTIEPAHGAYKTSFLYRLHKQHSQQEHMTIHSFDYKGKNLFDRLHGRLRPDSSNQKSSTVGPKSISQPDLFPPAGRKHSTTPHAASPSINEQGDGDAGGRRIVDSENTTTPRRLHRLLSASTSSLPLLKKMESEREQTAESMEIGGAVEDDSSGVDGEGEEISASVMTAPAGSKEQQDCLQHLWRQTRPSVCDALPDSTAADRARGSDRSINQLLSLWDGHSNTQHQ